MNTTILSEQHHGVIPKETYDSRSAGMVEESTADLGTGGAWIGLGETTTILSKQHHGVIPKEVVSSGWGKGTLYPNLQSPCPRSCSRDLR